MGKKKGLKDNFKGFLENTKSNEDSEGSQPEGMKVVSDEIQGRGENQSVKEGDESNPIHNKNDETNGNGDDLKPDDIDKPEDKEGVPVDDKTGGSNNDLPSDDKDEPDKPKDEEGKSAGGHTGDSVNEPAGDDIEDTDTEDNKGKPEGDHTGDSDNEPAGDDIEDADRSEDNEGKSAGSHTGDDIEDTDRSEDKEGKTEGDKSELRDTFIKKYAIKIKNNKVQKEIISIKGRKEKADKLFNFWSDKLDNLGIRYINDLLYDYNEEILGDFDGFERGKKSLVIAIENNPKKNKEILLKVLSNLKKEVDSMEKNSDIMAVERIKEESGVLYLKTDGLAPEDIQKLNEAMKSLLIIHKYLVNEKDSILAIDNQINTTIKELYSPLKLEIVSLDVIEERIDKLKIDAGDKNVDDLLDDDVDRFIEEILKGDDSSSKAMLEGVNKFHKSMVKFFNSSVIRAYNDVVRAKKSFKENHKQKDYIDAWLKLFVQLETFLEDFLSDFQIKPIMADRGDLFNPKIHLPLTEAEEDKDLKTDQIKEIVNKGFQFSEQLIFNDLDSDHVLKQVEVIVVRNK